MPAESYEFFAESTLRYEQASDTTVFADLIFTNSGVTGLASGIQTYRHPTWRFGRYMVRGVTPSGEGAVLLWSNDPIRFRYDRFEEGLLPTNGVLVYSNGGNSGSFTPNYTGVFERSEGGVQTTGHVNGSASLRIDLGEATLSGTIAFRETTDGVAMDRIRYEGNLTEIPTFSAEGMLREVVFFTGGQFLTDVQSMGTGTIGGIIVNDGSEGIFGAHLSFSTVTATGADVTYREIGVFNADRFTLCDGCADGS